MTGKVWLVGAGPSDPGLFTRKGEQILKQAEVVVYDDCGNTVVKYPTEEEAKEYIRNQESEAKDDI